MKENNPYENQKPQKKPPSKSTSTKEKLQIVKEKTQKPPVQRKA